MSCSILPCCKKALSAIHNDDLLYTVAKKYKIRYLIDQCEQNSYENEEKTLLVLLAMILLKIKVQYYYNLVQSSMIRY